LPCHNIGRAINIFDLIWTIAMVLRARYLTNCLINVLSVLWREAIWFHSNVREGMFGLNRSKGLFYPFSTSLVPFLLIWHILLKNCLITFSAYSLSNMLGRTYQELYAFESLEGSVFGVQRGQGSCLKKFNVSKITYFHISTCFRTPRSIFEKMHL